MTGKKYSFVCPSFRLILGMVQIYPKVDVSCPDPERSTRGNRRVPLNGSRFSKFHPRTRKPYDILTCLEDNSLPKVQNIKYIKIFEKISTAFHLKHRYPPAQEKQFITPHSHQWETISMSIQITQHNPLTKQLRRRKTENSISSYHIAQYSLRLTKIQTV